MKKRVYLLFLFILLYSFSANALIISPPERNYDFHPDYHYNFSFAVGGNNDNTPIDVKTYTKGDLEKYVTFNQENGVISPGRWTEFTGDIILPEKLKAGYHDTRVGVVQTSSKESGFSSLVGVEMILGVRVPYPGRYIENNLEVNDVRVNESVKFILTFHNYGSEDIEDVRSSIEIYGINGEKVDSLKVDSFSINNGETRVINFNWSSVGNKIGMYRAVLNSNYDGEELATSEKIFRIGDILIEIVSINGTKIDKGKIGRVLVSTRSYWNTNIDDVYALLEASTSNGLIQIKSQSITYSPWANLDIPLFVDGNKIDIGRYDAKIRIYYANKTAEKVFVLEIKENKFVKLFSTRNLLILIVIILIIVMILNFRKFIKNKK